MTQAGCRHNDTLMHVHMHTQKPTDKATINDGNNGNTETAPVRENETEGKKEKEFNDVILCLLVVNQTVVM